MLTLLATLLPLCMNGYYISEVTAEGAETVRIATPCTYSEYLMSAEYMAFLNENLYGEVKTRTLHMFRYQGQTYYYPVTRYYRVDIRHIAELSRHYKLCQGE